MNYLEEYIKKEEIEELKEMYNEGIIAFITENEEFVMEKLDYLKKEGYIIYPILKNNIKIFLELKFVLDRKIKTMKDKNFNKKQIQMVLMDEKIYNKM